MSLVRLGLVPVLGLLPLLSFGCSDPVPPTSRAAWTLAFVDPGLGCEIAGHNAAMGSVSENEKNLVLVDGEGGATVECTVHGINNFNVRAFAADSKNALTLNINIANLLPLATRSSPALGSLSFSSPTTGGETVSSNDKNPCLFWFVPQTREGIGPGQVWLAFECSKVAIDTSDSCRIQSGYAIFENCET